MDVLLKGSFLLGVIALSMLPGHALAGRQQRAPALAPERLVEIRAFLIRADRAEVSLLSGASHRGKIESVTETEIVLKIRSQGNQGPWRLETIATEEVRDLRLFHTSRRGWRSRVGRTLGFAAGLTIAGPVVYAAGEAGHGAGAWAAIVVIPALGVLAGERLSRRVQETFVPVTRSRYNAPTDAAAETPDSSRDLSRDARRAVP